MSDVWKKTYEPLIDRIIMYYIQTYIDITSLIPDSIVKIIKDFHGIYNVKVAGWHQIEWKIDTNIMNALKIAAINQRFYGPKMLVGTVLCGIYYEFVSDDNPAIFLNIEAPDHNISEMLISRKVNIKEINYEWEKTVLFKGFPDRVRRGTPKKDINLIRIREESELTITVTFRIKKIVDVNQNSIPQNMWYDILSNTEYEHKQHNIDYVVKRELNEFKEFVFNQFQALKNQINKIEKDVHHIKQQLITKHNTNDDEIILFLKEIELNEYYDVFTNNGIDTINDLKGLTKDDLIRIGIHKIGHRNRILNALKKQ